ncbi:uncharacterized protein QC764_0106700 [Podospora pseudoanserina]|uniref:Secreted protein n=1 Tax=Podospora pseudoanserina TaxID=2609844 RepID=A0ABR0HLB6_9PEZI|nr:hypothetical protein QC764_0106700 [Podospora pseudoanserina]
MQLVQVVECILQLLLLLLRAVFGWLGLGWMIAGHFCYFQGAVSRFTDSDGCKAQTDDLTHAAAVGSAATKSQQSLANKLFASLFRDTHSTGSLAVAENAFAYLIMVDGPSALKESAWWKSSSCFHFL